MKVSRKNYKFSFTSTTFKINFHNLHLCFFYNKFFVFRLLLIVPLILILIIFFVFLNTGCSILASKEFNISDKSDDVKSTKSEKAEEGQNSEDTIIAEENSEQTSGEAESTDVEEETSIVSDEEITINVYYADSTAEYLKGEAKTLSGSGKYVGAIFEMMKEPIDSSLIKLIPETTKINGVKVEDGTAKVDLSQDFVNDRFISDVTDILLVYSIVNTLTGFKEINSAEFYIDGEKLDILGQLDLEEPLFRRSDLIKD